MAARRVKSGRIPAAAAVAALHLVLVWLFLLGKVRLAVPPVMPPLSVMFFHPIAPAPIIRPHRNRAGHLRRPRRARSHPALTKKTLIAQPIAARRSPKVHSRSHINWRRALRTEVQSLESRPADSSKVRIGFPKMPQAAARTHHFGWDYAATHRVQALPTGGILFMINDHCAIVVAPLPFGGCALGKIKAKGDLFNHMKDSQDQGPGSLP